MASNNNPVFQLQWKQRTPKIPARGEETKVIRDYLQNAGLQGDVDTVVLDMVIYYKQ